MNHVDQQQQQQQQQPSSSANSLDVDVDITVASTSAASQDSAECQQPPEGVRTVVVVDVHESPEHRLDRVSLASNEEDDQENSESSSSVAESSSISDDERNQRCLNKVPQPVQQLMNGMMMPNSNGPKIDKVVVSGAKVSKIGDTTNIQGSLKIEQYFFGSPGVPGTPTRTWEQFQMLENKKQEDKDDEKNKDDKDVKDDKDDEEKKEEPNEEPEASADPSRPLYPSRRVRDDNLRIIKRYLWGAMTPRAPVSKLRVLPAPYVIISHTVGRACLSKDTCMQIVRAIQNMHMRQSGWIDIGYNFLVGGDGNVYVGRDWDIEAAQARGYNDRSIGIAFIGTFSSEYPTVAQLRAAKKLIELGARNNKLSTNYKLLGHCQVRPTESPGRVLFDIIKTWDHWSPSP